MRFGVFAGAAFLLAASLPAMAASANRIVAEGVNLADRNNIQLQIWSERVAQLTANRQRLQKAVPSLKLEAEFFTTSFTDGARKIIVSVVNDGCSSSSAAPDDLFCPARIVELANGKVRVLKEIGDFDIHMVRGDAGYDETSNRSSKDMSLAAFDPVKQEIVFTYVAGGQVQPDPVVVKLQ